MNPHMRNHPGVRKARNWTVGLGVTGALVYGVWTGLVAVDRVLRGDESVPHPDQVDYTDSPMEIKDFSVAGASGLPKRIYVWDNDKDGMVDAIGFAGTAHWVAPGYEDKYSTHPGLTRTMTPEMVDAVSDLWRDHQAFSRMIVERAYDLENSQEDIK